MLEGLTYDPKKHEYAYKGEAVPSVTTILNYGKKTFYAPGSAQRGTDVHSAIAAAEREGETWRDWLPSDPALAPYLEAYTNFRERYAFIPEPYDPFVLGRVGGLLYAGQFDTIGSILLPSCDRQSVMIDWKTGAKEDSHGPQIVAYKNALGFAGMNMIVYLKKTGAFEKEILAELDEARAWQAFTTKLEHYYAAQERTA